LQALRAQVPPVPHPKSTGHVWPAPPHAVGAQWWLAPQVSPAAQSAPVEHPATQPVFGVPQTHGSARQISGTAASVGQSESEVHGCVTIAQAPPQTDCPGTVQK
jgi:hypothetical protein